MNNDDDAAAAADDDDDDDAGANVSTELTMTPAAANKLLTCCGTRFESALTACVAGNGNAEEGFR